MRHLILSLSFLLFFSYQAAWSQPKAQQTTDASLESAAQSEEKEEDSQDMIQVFLDCSTCDMNYLRQELNHFDYVRDPMLADVHVLVTRQFTGGGSQSFELAFMGRENFSSFQQKLTYTVPPNTSQDKQRKEFAHIFSLGLIPYLAQTSMANSIEIRIAADLDDRPMRQEYDPWGNWVFEVSGSGSVRKEEQRNDFALRGGLEANRVTALWRIQNRFNFNFNQKYFTQEGEEFSSETRYLGYRGGATRSLTDHWSAGAFFNASSSTYNNMELSTRLGPALEYSLFSYEEVNRREVTLAYHFGVMYRDYIEQTVFGKEEEALMQQSVRLAARFRQPWGSIFASAEGSHFFHDLAKNRVDIDGYVSLRVAKGLAVSLNGNVELIRDQLSLAAGGSSLEDLLLQQSQLATGYKLAGSIGLNYTFGSIYNNVVNTRL